MRLLQHRRLPAGLLPCLLCCTLVRAGFLANQTASPRTHGPCTEAHLACAAAEAPLLLQADQQYFGGGLAEATGALQGAGLLARHPLARADGGALHYVGLVGNPASKIRCGFVSEIGGDTAVGRERLLAAAACQAC